MLILFSCSKKDKTFQDITRSKDSLDIFLNLAAAETLSVDQRLQCNNVAFNILQYEMNDSVMRENLFRVANRYYNLQFPQLYKKSSRFVLTKAIQASDSADIAKAYSYLGDYYYYNVNPKDSALFYFLSAEKIYDRLKDHKNLAQMNIMKANVFWNEKDYFGSESAALDALKYGRLADSHQKEYEALTFLGIISNELDDFEKALEYLNRAVVVIENNKLSGGHQLPITLNNIGNVYQNLGKNELAIKNLEKALSQHKLIQENPDLYAALLDNLAYSKFQSKKNDAEIESLFQRSIAISDSLQNLTSLIYSKTRLAEYYYSIGDTIQAITLSKDALATAKKSNPIDLLRPLKQLSNYIPENAGLYSTEYIKINDSLQEVERKVKDRFARIQFETNEIILQNDKLEEQNRNLLLFFVGTVMIGLLLFVIRTQRAKNRELLHKQAQQKANEDIYNLMLSQQNKIEEGRIQEKRRIAQELHDGVLGRLFGARLNLDSLNKMDGEDAEEKRNNYLAELKNIEQDIREISHDLNREKFVLINNFVAILNNLLEEQAASFDTTVHANIDNTIKWDRISNSLKINLYRIVQEALQNINKYAKASTIEVSLTQKDGHINLSISDNGIGFAVEKKSRGIGLQNMVSRANECEGVFDIRSKKGKGTTISIEFPIESKSITA